MKAYVILSVKFHKSAEKSDNWRDIFINMIVYVIDISPLLSFNNHSHFNIQSVTLT